MAENVLSILCIRLINEMAFVSCIKNNIHRKTENILFVKFTIFNINFNVIFIIFRFLYLIF